MPVFIDLTGKRFGRLIVLNIVQYNKCSRIHWKCKCDCGNIKNINGTSLKLGVTKSCGCYRDEQIKKANTKHGMEHTKFYKSWQHLKERCGNKNSKDYKWYGGRGITYNSRWENFLEFKKDMYFKYLYAKKQLKIQKLTIERLDVNGNYCFDNCCFIELKDQWKNTRKTNAKCKGF
jgi:hypothetical protein